MAYKTYNALHTDTRTDNKTGFVMPRAREGWSANQRYERHESSVALLEPRFYGMKADSTMLIAYGPSVSTYNQLYGKVVEEAAGKRGELLTSIVEWQSSLDMITKRVKVLTEAYKALRKFDLPRVAYILSLTERQKRKVEGRVKKYHKIATPTSLWLEYWMGWAPLHGDIAHAIETLQAPPRSSGKLKVGVSYSHDVRSVQQYSREQVINQMTAQGHIAAYGEIEVTNPNLGLANQLGFTNPALTLWQIVPFSFIVDWFVNIGQVVSSLNDFAGVRINNPGYGFMTTGQRRRDGYITVYEQGVPRLEYFAQTMRGTHRKRLPGSIPGPQLVAQIPRLSITRAATSISLLVEIFLIKK